MPSSSATDVPGLSVYPVSDIRFRHAVETSYGGVDGLYPTGEGLLAAVSALIRPSYPLATVQPRGWAGHRDETFTWDAFRDGTVLDDELVRRARAGAPDATGQLYDRHAALAHDIALRTAGIPQAAADAVVTAFRTLMGEDDGHMTVRVRVARAARDAALDGSITSVTVHEDGDPMTQAQRTVIRLAHAHRFLGADIATVLRMDVRDVCRLANEGLAALASSTRAGGARQDRTTPPT